MYSDIVINSLNEVSVDAKRHIKEEDELNITECPSREELLYKRTFNNFVKEHRDILDYIYEKQFKEFQHISKEKFYIFAYSQSSINEQLTRSYRN